MANVRSMSTTSLYSMLKSEILKDDPAFEVYEAARKWVDRMLDYKMPKGKLILGLPLVESYMTLKEGTELTHDDIFLACTLGWCFEWLQAYFIVLDDIISESDPKKGRPGWYKVQKVGNFAVNDWVLLRNHIAIKQRILRKYYRSKPYYVELVDLFNEVEFQINSGRMVEAISTLDSEKKLSKFTMSFYRRSAKYKRSYYLFYFPVACALLLSGEKLENHLDMKDILVEMSIYYQTQEDYLNCFGDPKVLGKKGTDIEDFKCSWLVIKALELSNEEQKKVLYVNYGKKYPISTTRVKALYKELNLQDVFNEHERKCYEKLMTSIEVIPNKTIQFILKSFLTKIHKRHK